MFSNPEKILIQFGLAESLSVADFGAGAGYYAKLLARRVGETGKVFCIDVTKEMLRKLANDAEKEKLNNLEVVCGDVEKEEGSTLPNDSQDAVIIANTLFALEDKTGVANEAKRILRKKGRVLLVEWADSFAGMGPHKSHVVKKEEAKRIFETAGFKFEREIDAGEHHYGFVFRKI